ncbi:carboxypeptidase regulatory-like domain-containing protein [Bacillus sp. FJAT-27245]|uniref:carboxypeptidase regulatory-like domain-containing protein n=1 Tax=Bacillus sp. FJAT-27245 TaxID=1684144 RepID=UPI0018D14D90|nr:carboxypeptidase regulatory-like domain-containing protein [Bacillus sp. FJAT-27245]
MKNGIKNFKRTFKILLILFLLGNATVPVVSAEKLISSIKLDINGEMVNHAFGDKSYEFEYYKNMTLNVIATYTDGTTDNVTNDSLFTYTDIGLLVKSNGTLIGNNDSIVDVIVTYQNKQAIIKIQSIWDYVNGSYVLQLLSNPTYGELSKSKVIIDDANLEGIIREALNKPVGTISEDEMKTITSIDASYQNINNLTGLEFATNLEELNLEGNDISDLKSLSRSINLKKLWIGYNQISDLQPLSNLNQLTELYVWENKLKSLKGLEKLKSLLILDAHNNKLNDIKDIHQLNNLLELNLNVNEISTIPPLTQLTSLETVQLSRNEITDVQVFKHLKRVKWIDITGNPLNTKKQNINILEELDTRGVYIDFNSYDNNPIKFADPKLEQAISQFLNLPTPIKKGDIRHIEFLDLTNKGIANLKGLEDATALQVIHLNFNPLTNIDALKNLNQLNWVEINRVTLNSNSMETIQFLQGNDVYVDFDANYNSELVQFEDQNLEDAISEYYSIPTPLTKGDLQKIEYLFLSNGIKKLKGLEHATNLIGLYIDGNSITKIDELMDLNHLKEVSIKRNPLAQEALGTIKELENKGITVEYDEHFDSTPIDIHDPILEYLLGEYLNIPNRILKGDLNQVESLNLTGQDRAIIRIDGIENATSVKKLFLDDNLISDLSSLANMNQLSELHLRNNNIKDLTPLLQLTNLRYLDIKNNLFDASPGSPARKIISTLQERGVSVEFNETPDTVLKGSIVDENEILDLYSYIMIQGNGRSYKTPWSNVGKISVKLGEGTYAVTEIVIKNEPSNLETIRIFQPFVIKDGKLYVNGELKESLDVTVTPFTLSGKVLDENGNSVSNATVQIKSESNIRTFDTITDGAGNFIYRLSDGPYKISRVSIGNEHIALNIPFEIKNGKLFVDGELRDQLEIKIPQASLKGILLDENGVPLANATVELVGIDNTRYSANTDAKGHFTLRLADGTYRMQNIFIGNTATPFNIPIEIKDGKLLVDGKLKEHIEIKLPPTSFRGTLQDENGTPVVNANVQISSISEGNHQWYGTNTDTQGHFSYPLIDGEYRLNYVSIGNSKAPLSIIFQIKNGKLYVNGELKEQLEVKLPPVTLKGRLLDENGIPFADASIEFDGDSGWFGTWTDAQGAFTARLADGVYRASHVWTSKETIAQDIQFEIRNGKIYVNGELKNQIEITLPPVTLKGSLVDEDGIPVPNASIYIEENGRGYSTQTDAKGNFTKRLVDGMYRITQVWNGKEGTQLNVYFEMKEGKLYINGEPKAQLEVRLQPVTVKGNLVDEKGLPVVKANVQISGNSTGNNQWYGTNTDDHGSFSYRLADGEYRLNYVSTENSCAPISIIFEIRDGKLYVDGEFKEQLELKLPPISFKGILLENGQSVKDATVFVEVNGIGVPSRTDAQGNFSYRLIDGIYRISYIWNGNEGIQQNIPFEIKEGKLYVLGEQIEKLELNLPPVTLKGTLVEDNGIPVANVSVEIEGDNTWFSTRTDAQGAFTARITDGAYRIYHVWTGKEAIPVNFHFEIENGKIYVNGILSNQLDIKLPPVTLKGYLVDEAGIPVSNASIYIEANSRGYSTTTDAEGYFSNRLVDGMYRIYHVWNGKEGLQLDILFEIKEGKLFVNGDPAEILEIKAVSINP